MRVTCGDAQGCVACWWHCVTGGENWWSGDCCPPQYAPKLSAPMGKARTPISAPALLWIASAAHRPSPRRGRSRVCMRGWTSRCRSARTGRGYVLVAVVADVHCWAVPGSADRLMAVRAEPAVSDDHGRPTAKISAATAGCDISAVVVVGMRIAAPRRTSPGQVPGPAAVRVGRAACGAGRRGYRTPALSVRDKSTVTGCAAGGPGLLSGEGARIRMRR